MNDEIPKGEALHQAVYNYARHRTFNRHAEAVRRGIINEHQADQLMQLWDELNPYEPLDP